MLMLILSGAQEGGTPGTTNVDPVTNYPESPEISKKLGDLFKQMEVKPDPDGTVKYLIDSGFFFDKRERKKYVFHKKAVLYMAQSQITKIQFEYYQFSMDSMLKEIKTITNASPNSADLKNVEISYWSSAGEENKYRVGDLKNIVDKRKVLYQYIDYLKLLLHKTEVLRNRLARKETHKVDKTVDLGDREQ
jgi:hypothetical protein